MNELIEEIRSKKEKVYTIDEYRCLQNKLEEERRKNEQLKGIISILLKDF